LKLSQDLLEEILCRVPAISLKQLRSTCKRWNSLFNDKRFARKHFDKAAKQSLVVMLTKNYRICLLDVNLNETPSIEVRGELRRVSISQVFHCDGLLIYINKGDTMMVVWNPFMGKIRWSQHIDRDKTHYDYVLGSYQDDKSGNTSYKVLRYMSWGSKQKLEICELYSSSWRILDVTTDCTFYGESRVSLKGKTYWFAFDEEKRQLDMVSFDYTTERFRSRMSLPYQFPIVSYQTLALSGVREEKLSVLLQLRDTSRKEIWVTNKIDETTQVLSWNKVLTLDYPDLGRCFLTGLSFLFDEENRKIVCCERRMSEDDYYEAADWVYIVEEDNKVTQLCFGKCNGFDTLESSDPYLFGYVPSLVQIEHPRHKTKRGD
ncbi:F-box domain, partial [Arabidopsis suecica]